ncbi:MAG: hypothetical protein ACOYMW_13810 [Candidatus Competibacteraceae bacterium]
MSLIKGLFLMAGLAIGAGAWAATDSGISQGSVLSAEGASALVAGSVEVVASSPSLIVLAINRVAEGSVVVLKSASTAATVSVKVTDVYRSFTGGSAERRISDRHRAFHYPISVPDATTGSTPAH